MPTIIECPACSTRYKMNKQIPDGGRYVKCARCGHQWRLVPDGSAEAETETRDEHGNSMAMGHSAPEAAAAHHTATAGDEGGEWQEQRDQLAAAMAGMGDEAADGEGWDDGDAGGSHAALKNAWMDFESQEHGADAASNGAGVAAGDDDDWAERIKRSSWGSDEGEPGVGVAAASPASEDPEQAIRQALKNALNNPEEAPVAVAGGTEHFQDFWQGFAGQGEGEEADGLDEQSAGVIAAQIENVRRSSVIYDPNTLREGYAGEEDGTGDPAIHSDIAAAFSHDTAQKKPLTRPDFRHDASLTDYDDGMGDGAAAEGEYGDYLNGDAAALQAQLESFGQMHYEEPRRGGLAVVAAWAVFLSIVSGVALAFVNFRDNIMTALPGTTRLYQTLGFDAGDRRIDFGNVGYRWTMHSGKPMIEVKGQIINLTDREIEVPRVLITVHDAQAGDGVKAVETVRTEPLGARATAPFTLEFMSPSKTVSQIELEFDAAR